MKLKSFKGRTDCWVCNVLTSNLPRIRTLIESSDVWANRPVQKDWEGKPYRDRLYIHGRNGNRKQFKDLYSNCMSGTQSAIRKEHASYFGVYTSNALLSKELRNLILENIDVLMVLN